MPLAVALSGMTGQTGSLFQFIHSAAYFHPNASGNSDAQTWGRIIRSDSVKGDYDGNGTQEWMWLESPSVNDDGSGCSGDCNCRIRFSDPSLPLLTVKNCIGGIPVNHGDLNGNGSDEIGLLPEWFTSTWCSYQVWTFRKGQWIHAVDPFPTHLSQWDDGVIPIEKAKEQPGFVIIRYSKFDDRGISLKEKKVRIKK